MPIDLNAATHALISSLLALCALTLLRLIVRDLVETLGDMRRHYQTGNRHERSGVYRYPNYLD